MPTLGLLLKPLDVLLFREPRPYGPGDSGRSGLPLPQTFAGLIKTYLTRQFGWSSGDWHGRHSQNEQDWPWHVRLKFRGPWLFADKCELVPRGPLVATPADIVRAGKSDNAPLDRLRPLSDAHAAMLPPCAPDGCQRPLWFSQGEAPTSAGGLLDTVQLAAYLTGSTPSAPHMAAEVFDHEQRTGIGISPDRLTADQERGLIYSASFLRLHDGICFYGEVELPGSDVRPGPRGEPVAAVEGLFAAGQPLPWGGEGRRVMVERTTAFDWASLQPATVPEPADRYLSLLISPGIFSNGKHRWKPRELGTLVAAAVGKPLPVSGWDMAGDAGNDHQPRPRPTRFAVPAGAVYFWERGNRALKQGKTQLPAPLESPCDRPQDRDNGWGLSLFGHWNEYNFNEKGSSA